MSWQEQAIELAKQGRPRKFNKLVAGQVYTMNDGSKLKVLQVLSGKEVLAEFQDEYKHIISVDAHRIVNGLIKNPYYKSVYGVGFTGVGEYSSSVKGKHTLAYSRWKGMLERCYSEKFKKGHPSYKDCVVAEDWHNFQNFAGWFYSQRFSDVYELDKDLLFKGNKLYSANTCCFLPKEINSALVRSICDPDNTIGIKITSSGKYSAEYRDDSGKKYLGSFSTEMEAFQNYAAARKSYIKSLAEKFRDTLDSRAFCRLMEWEV
jgi:hypothetical protein